MDAVEQLKNLAAALGQCQATLRDLRGAVRDPGTHQQLALLGAGLQEALGQVAEALQAETAAAGAPGAASGPEAPAGTAGAPDLGQQLRQELLERFGPGREPAPSGGLVPRADPDRWEDWEG
jgi:hypothetical protein